MKTVREIMTEPVMIRSSATIEAAILLIQVHQVRSLVVEKCHEDGCYGLLVEQDIVHKVVALGIDPSHIRVGSLMWQACILIPPKATLREAAQILAEAEISHAPVIEAGKLLGTVSITDILRQLCPVEAPAGNQQQQTDVAWWRPQQTTARMGGDSRLLQPQIKAQLAFDDDMRFGCKTVF